MSLQIDARRAHGPSAAWLFRHGRGDQPEQVTRPGQQPKTMDWLGVVLPAPPLIRGAIICGWPIREIFMSNDTAVLPIFNNEASGGLVAGLVGGGLLGSLHRKNLGLDKADRAHLAA